MGKMKESEGISGRLKVFQFYPRLLMFQNIFTGIEYFNAHDRSIGSIVNGNVFRDPLRGRLEFALFEPDIRSIYLGIIADFHYKCLLKIKNVYGYDNNRFFFFDDGHQLFNEELMDVSG